MSSTLAFDSSVDLPELEWINLGKETLYGQNGRVASEDSWDSEVTLVMKSRTDAMESWKISPNWCQLRAINASLTYHA